VSNLKNYHNKYYYIYKIVNLYNKKCYVGFHATNKEYENDNYYGSSNIVKDLIDKHGAQKFVMGIIEYINPKEWREKEQFWIKEMNSHVSREGYNLTFGGDGCLGLQWTEDQKSKLRKPNKRHSEFMTGRTSPRKGVVLDQELKDRISKSHEGLKQSDKTKENKNESIKLFYKNNPTIFIKRCWITNESLEMRIHKEDKIPDGWRRGRKLKNC
jgi:group I intron endonuclease